MKYLKITLLFAVIHLGLTAFGQLKPGFDKEEYKQLMLVSARTIRLIPINFRNQAVLNWLIARL